MTQEPDYTCNTCQGTGEGQFDRLSCQTCRGMGEVLPEAGPDDVDFEKPDDYPHYQP